MPSNVSPSIQPFAWLIPNHLPDDLRYVQMIRLPEPIFNTLQSLRPPAPKTVAIASLHDALATFSPEILTFANPLEKTNIHRSWLYAVNDTTIDVKRLQTLIEVWLRVCYGGTGQAMAASWRRLSWDLDQIDLQDSAIDMRLKRMLLPGLAARWLLRQGYHIALEDSTNELQYPLRLVPLMTQHFMAELVSEPDDRSEPFSLVTRFWLDTMPDTGEPILLNKTSLRRWITRPLLRDSGWLDMKPGRGKSVYLRRSTGYLDGGLHEDIFTRITLKCIGRGETGLCWMGKQPSLFKELALDGAPPNEQDLARNPSRFHHSALMPMESQNAEAGDAAPGLHPGDHKRLFLDVNTHLASCFEPLSQWTRAEQGDLRRGTKTPSQQKSEKISAKTRFAALLAMPQPIHIELHVEDVESTKAALLAHVGALETNRARIRENPLQVMDGERLLIEIRQGSNPALTDLLPETALKNPNAHQQAVLERRATIARNQGIAQHHIGALVKLTDYRKMPQYKRRDPKEAIRGGLIDANRVSQFLTPQREDDRDDYELRMKMAVADLLRTLGYRFNPFYIRPTDSSMPDEIDFVALWVIQLNARDQSEQTVVLPLVVDVPSGHHHIRVFIPRDTGSAELFPTLREAICGAVKFSSDFRTAAESANFFRDALSKRDSKRPTLLMLPDQNLRRVYPELNSNAKTSRISLYGALENMPQTRVARLRFSRQDEAPFCAPGTAKGKYQGLYQHPNYPNTFYSLHNVGERHQSFGFHKLDRLDKPAVNPSTVQIHMSNLQPGDAPAEWAGLVHRLRLESSHTDTPTVYPQPLHDAQDIIKKYLSRLADEDSDELNALGEIPQGGNL